MLLSKRKCLCLLTAFAAIFVIACLTCCLCSNDMDCSDFQNALADRANVEFIDMPSWRSELFPVAGREDGRLWRIAVIEDEEIFVTSFSNSKEAQECYWASIDQCKENSLYVCGHDVIYYRGDNSDILLTLQQISSVPPK